MNNNVENLNNGDFKVTYENLGAIQDEIDKLEDNIPDRRTKQYIEWKERINYLMNLYNHMSDQKIYQIIK